MPLPMILDLNLKAQTSIAVIKKARCVTKCHITPSSMIVTKHVIALHAVHNFRLFLLQHAISCEDRHAELRYFSF